jgi:hypothetical protein
MRLGDISAIGVKVLLCEACGVEECKRKDRIAKGKGKEMTRRDTSITWPRYQRHFGDASSSLVCRLDATQAGTAKCGVQAMSVDERDRRRHHRRPPPAL